MGVHDAFHHEWQNVQTADVVDAYQAAVVAAGRAGGYRPFTRLRYVRGSMCYCTPPSVWHALLLLMRHAVHLRSLAVLSTNDPLIAAALAHLPSITSLGADCLWPHSFATFIERRSMQTGHYLYVAPQPITRYPFSGCPGPATSFELIDATHEKQQDRRVRLLPHSTLFTAYQRSLSAEQQAVLARWARGDFHVDDGRLSGAESAMERDEDDPSRDPRQCPHPHFFYGRFQAAEEEAKLSGKGWSVAC